MLENWKTIFGLLGSVRMRAEKQKWHLVVALTFVCALYYLRVG
jgi:hypothetical protein